MMKNDAMDAQNIDILDLLVKTLPQEPSPYIRIWSDGKGDIYCQDENVAEVVIDFLVVCGYPKYLEKGYFDPEEADEYGFDHGLDGWWYVTEQKI